MMTAPPIASLRKCRTVAIDKDEVDFRVLQFRCANNSALTSVGKHSKETIWKVSVGSFKKTLDIQVNVDRSVVGNWEIGVICDGRQVFPPVPGGQHFPKGTQAPTLSASERQTVKGRVSLAAQQEDFVWRLPFRGTVPGLSIPKNFEIRPIHLAAEQWLPATLKEQLEDDYTFSATVFMPDGNGGEREVAYPRVKLENIRFKETRKPVSFPERHLVLIVPSSDPLHATLEVDNELITHFFARPTPPPAKPPLKQQKSRITLQVTKDRGEVSADVGYAKFQHFLVGDVRSIKSDASRTRHCWVIQVGPFAEHVIELTKHPKASKVYVLTVDGEVLVEAAAEDIESREDWWECQFRFTGEKFLDWEVFETDVDGNPLESKGVVTQKRTYSHEVVVSFMTADANLSRANMHVDNVAFSQLAQIRNYGQDQNLRCSPEALRGTYNLMTPYKVNDQATDSFGTLRKVLGGMFCSPDIFLNCCSRPAVEIEPSTYGAPRAMSPPPRGVGPDDAVIGPRS